MMTGTMKYLQQHYKMCKRYNLLWVIYTVAITKVARELLNGWISEIFKNCQALLHIQYLTSLIYEHVAI